MFSVLKRSFCAAALLAGLTTSVWAEEYRPPSSPEIYAKEPMEPPMGLPTSHFFADGGFSIGQSRQVGRGSPRASYLGSAEFGYTKYSGVWSRVEPSLQLFTGAIGSGDAKMAVPVGGLVKIGYGYSLGSRMFGIWRLGAGGALADFDYSDSDGNAFKSKSLTLGTAIHLGFDLAIPVTQSFEILIGLGITQFSFGIGDVTTPSGKTQKLNQAVTVNVTDLKLAASYLL